MNICTFLILIKINPMLDFRQDIWPNFHIQIFSTRFILSLLKVNEKSFKLGPQVEVNTLKAKE
jgi:hypothetical protein